MLGVQLSKFSVIQFTYHPQGPEIVSIGVLNPAALAAHPPPTVLDADALRELATVWSAVTAPEPDALSALVADKPKSLPLLHRSLAGLISRYPGISTGLNGWELELLRYTQEVGPKAMRVIGHTIGHDMEYPDWVGDDYLLLRLGRLGDPALPHPLVTLTGSSTDLREMEVRLTKHGEDVLAGRANGVELNGIDDWVGGVHLDSVAGRVWFNDDGRLVRAM